MWQSQGLGRTGCRPGQRRVLRRVTVLHVIRSRCDLIGFRRDARRKADTPPELRLVSSDLRRFLLSSAACQRDIYRTPVMLPAASRTLARPRFPMQPHLVAGRRRATSTTSSTTHPSQSLPRLPVPDLNKSLRSYLRSLEPLLLEQEARGGPAFKDAYETRVKLAEDFEHGVGKLCQERLFGMY